MATRFTVDDCGCWADGAHGHEHIRQTLASLMHHIRRGLPRTRSIDVTMLRNLLYEAMSDDAQEETDALEALNDAAVTEPGISWQLVDGDLLLLADHEREGC